MSTKRAIVAGVLAAGVVTLGVLVTNAGGGSGGAADDPQPVTTVADAAAGEPDEVGGSNGPDDHSEDDWWSTAIEQVGAPGEEGAGPPTTELEPIDVSGYPSAATTGVPSDIELMPSGPLVIAEPGTVIDGYDVRGTIRIQADDVTIRNTRVQGSGFALIEIDEGVTGAVVEDVEIDGLGRDGGTRNSMGVLGPVTVRRANIHGVENGVTPYSGSLVEDSWIHDLGAPGDPHYDGIQIDGDVMNVEIRHNHVDLTEHGQTSAVMIDNYFGPTSDVAVVDNLLKGGGYTVYSDAQFSGGPIEGVRFVDNVLVSGYWGFASIEDNTPVWTNNRDLASGERLKSSGLPADE